MAKKPVVRTMTAEQYKKEQIQEQERVISGMKMVMTKLEIQVKYLRNTEKLMLGF
jgi:hypothetical protein